MTKLRAVHGALACGALSLAMGGVAHSDVSNFTIINGIQSNVDNACVGALPGATGEDCTYNNSNPSGAIPGDFVGPVRGAGYYLPGDSPFVQNPGVMPLPAAPVPDPGNVELTVTGSLVIDDKNGFTCDGDDTIAGRLELPAGTRAFAGGPGTWAEETWGENTVAYVLAESVPDFQNAVGGGCEYIFGDKGFPPLLRTLGPPALTYPVDTDMISDAAATNPPASDAWDTATVQAIGVGTFEGANFDGNNGVAVFLDEAMFFAGSWQCVDNFGDVNNPTAELVNGACDTSAAAGTPCSSAGSHFCGVRGIGNPDFVPPSPNDGKGQENWIIRIFVAASGNVDEGAIFANNESVVFNLPPAPNANNSWDGPLITFQATCDDCRVANDDSYRFVTGTPSPASLDIGANDDPTEPPVLDTDNTSLTVDAPGPSRGTCDVSANNPGNVRNIVCSYTSADNFASAGTDTFSYTLDDGVTPAEFGLQASVTVTVEDDIPPVANAYNITFDTQGVDPSTLRNTTDYTDGTNGVPGNSGGNNPMVSADATSVRGGTITVSGTEITYQSPADFFQGTDTFNYQIDDNNFGSPGIPTETAGPAQVTVTIDNVLPTTSDVIVPDPVDGGESVAIVAAITAGNGTVDQHTVDSECDNGTLEIDGVAVNNGDVLVNGTYTAPSDFDGQAVCTYTVTDEDGAGDAVDGTVTITVTESGIAVKLPGAGSALDPALLILLLLTIFARLRVAHPSAEAGATKMTGARQ